MGMTRKPHQLLCLVTNTLHFMFSLGNLMTTVLKCQQSLFTVFSSGFRCGILDGSAYTQSARVLRRHLCLFKILQLFVCGCKQCRVSGLRQRMQ